MRFASAFACMTFSMVYFTAEILRGLIMCVSCFDKCEPIVQIIMLAYQTLGFCSSTFPFRLFSLRFSSSSTTITINTTAAFSFSLCLWLQELMHGNHSQKVQCGFIVRSNLNEYARHTANGESNYLFIVNVLLSSSVCNSSAENLSK